MIRLIDLSTNSPIILVHGSNILGRGQHGITDRHCSRKQAAAHVNYDVQPPTLHITPLGMNPIRQETAAGMVAMNRGEACEYKDGSIFALFGDHKYQVRIGPSSCNEKEVIVIDLVDEKPEGNDINSRLNEEGSVHGDESKTHNNSNHGGYSLNFNGKRTSPPLTSHPLHDRTVDSSYSAAHFHDHSPLHAAKVARTTDIPPSVSPLHRPSPQSHYQPGINSSSHHTYTPAPPARTSVYHPFTPPSHPFHNNIMTTSGLKPISSPLSFQHHDPNKDAFKLKQAEKSEKKVTIPKTTHGKLAVIYHSKCLDHNVPDWHLETSERLRIAIEIINQLSREYSDSIFHVVRDPIPPEPIALTPSVNPSPYLSYEPLENPSIPSLSQSFSGSLQLPNAITHTSSALDVPSTSTPKLPSFKLVSREVLESCHDSGYLDSIMSKIPSGSQPLHATQYSQDDREPDQGDTFVSSGTWDAAVYAASVVCLAVDYIANEHYLHSFCAVRPPGHHAGIKGRTRDACSQGYCILNNVAIGAMYAYKQYPQLFSRIAIVDFDVHHGNGTQEILGSRQGFLFVSIHVGDLYPHTGGIGEKVQVSNHGRVVNISLHPHSGPKTFKRYFEEAVIPKLEEFGPQLLFLSSGFDGHKADPTEGGMRLTKAEYRYITELLKEVAMRHCGGKLISVLEGGYHLPSLKKCIEEHLTVLADD